MGLIFFVFIIWFGYLLLLKTNNNRKGDFAPFIGNYITHRGLFDNLKTPENSMQAFKKSAERNYGIELDVQITADDNVVVFHDETLKRMCGADIWVAEATYQELQNHTLLDTQEKIPLFADVLSEINGKVPLLIEIKLDEKSNRKLKVLCERVLELLQNYNGAYTIQSFSPFVLLWFKKNAPHIIRGQLSTDYVKENENAGGLNNFIFTNLLMNAFTEPDYIAYDAKHVKQFSYYLCKKIYNPITIGWTIYNQGQLDEKMKHYDNVIFEGFIPKTQGE